MKTTRDDRWARAMLDDFNSVKFDSTSSNNFIHSLSIHPWINHLTLYLVTFPLIYLSAKHCNGMNHENLSQDSVDNSIRWWIKTRSLNINLFSAVIGEKSVLEVNSNRLTHRIRYDNVVRSFHTKLNNQKILKSVIFALELYSMKR